MNSRDSKRIADKLAKVRAADAAHDAKMAVIAKRGGKTLDRMRMMTMANKDRFIGAHVVSGEYDAP